MKKVNKILSVLLCAVILLATVCSTFNVSANTVNTFALSTDYQDSIITENATVVTFTVKFDVGSQYGFVGGDFQLNLPDEINSIKNVEVTANTKLNGGTLSNNSVSIATQNNKIRFIADDAKTSLKSISLKITLDIVSTLVKGKKYEIKVSAYEGDFKDDQPLNEEIKFDTNTKSVSVLLQRADVSKPSSAPELSSKTATSVTLMATVGYEYKRENGEWQISNVFNGLSPNTTYKFYQRTAMTDTHNASSPSDSLTVTTYKATATKPSAPTYASKTDTSVILRAKVGYEYKCNNGSWQSSNVFSGLTPNTTYSFYQRKAETDTHYVSDPSDALTVTTNKATPSKPTAPKLSSKTETTVTLSAMVGYEYKCNNGSWQSSNIFSGLKADTTYSFYQRKAETGTYNASESSDELKVKTNAAAPTVPNKITSNKFTVGSNTVSKITAGTNAATLLNGINEKQYCKVYKGNTVVSGDTTLGTGMTVKLLDGNKVKATYTIIITGDVNGDGKITAADYVNVKFAVLGKQSLSGAYKTAADVNGDSKVTAADYVNIKFKVLGKTQITPR